MLPLLPESPNHTETLGLIRTQNTACDRLLLGVQGGGGRGGGIKIKREGAEVFNMRQASSGDGMMGKRCRAAMAEARDKQ